MTNSGAYLLNLLCLFEARRDKDEKSENEILDFMDNLWKKCNLSERQYIESFIKQILKSGNDEEKVFMKNFQKENK